MIQLIRVDERLLHGQVAYSWKAQLSYQAIVIASDNAAQDDLRRATIKLACPPDVKLAVRSTVKAAELLNNPKLASMKVFVVCENVATLYSLLPLLNEKPAINLGGQGKNDGRSEFSPALYLSEEDKVKLDCLLKEGYSITVQQTPSEKKQTYEIIRRREV